MTQLPEGMPELPEVRRDEWFPYLPLDGEWMAVRRDSTRDQMRAYGLACYQAGMERAAVICEGLDSNYDPGPQEFAAAIRAEAEKARKT